MAQNLKLAQNLFSYSYYTPSPQKNSSRSVPVCVSERSHSARPQLGPVILAPTWALTGPDRVIRLSRSNGCTFISGDQNRQPLAAPPNPRSFLNLPGRNTSVREKQ
jgi:hypothetical protein